MRSSLSILLVCPTTFTKLTTPNLLCCLHHTHQQVLQDHVPHKDIATVRAIVEEAYVSGSGHGGQALSFDEVFSSFESEPIGAASIGQAHRATLTKEAEAAEAAEDTAANSTTGVNGGSSGGGGKLKAAASRNVIVKVQYPEVEGRFRGDIFTLINFCKVLYFQLLQLLRD